MVSTQSKRSATITAVCAGVIGEQLPTSNNGFSKLAKLTSRQLNCFQRVLADFASDLCIGSKLHPNAACAVRRLCRSYWDLQALPLPVYCEVQDLIGVDPAAVKHQSYLSVL